VTEEQRAREWRRRQARIAAATRARELALAGNDASYQHLVDDWRPYLCARRDWRGAYQPVDLGDDCGCEDDR